MKYIKFYGGNGYCDCDFEQYEVYEDKEVNEDFLNDIAEELGMDNAQSFEYVVTGWDEDFESEEDREIYYENIEYGWVEITKEEYEENQR